MDQEQSLTMSKPSMYIQTLEEHSPKSGFVPKPKVGLIRRSQQLQSKLRSDLDKPVSDVALQRFMRLHY